MKGKFVKYLSTYIWVSWLGFGNKFSEKKSYWDKKYYEISAKTFITGIPKDDTSALKIKNTSFLFTLIRQSSVGNPIYSTPGMYLNFERL